MKSGYVKTSAMKEEYEEIASPYDVKIRSVTCANGVLYSTLSENAVLKYHIEDDRWELEELGIQSKDHVYPYLANIVSDNIRFLVPGRGDCFLMRENEGYWEEVKLPNEFTRDMDKGLLVMGFFIKNDKIFMLPRAASGMIVFDIGERKTYYKKIRISEKSLRRIDIRHKFNEVKSDIIVENEELSLRCFIEDRIEIHHS